MEIKIIDSHSHLQFNAFDLDREEVVNNMRSQGVATIIIGGNLENSEKAIELAEKENFWASIGLHPVHIEELNDDMEAGQCLAENFNENDYVDLVKNDRVVAIGECGLDWFHLKDIKNKEIERQNFIRQIDFAKKYQKPLILHIRAKQNLDAYYDALEILKQKGFNEKSQDSGVVHFFGADLAVAKEFLGLGFYLGFTGVITFTDVYDKIIKEIPMERILIETDCPYVAPEPFRGKRNDPTMVKYVAEKIAKIKNISFDEMVEVTKNNCIKLFNLSIK